LRFGCAAAVKVSINPTARRRIFFIFWHFKSIKKAGRRPGAIGSVYGVMYIQFPCLRRKILYADAADRA
jgi:hypothetical protein